jgi:hypothetical protein
MLRNNENKLLNTGKLKNDLEKTLEKIQALFKKD